MVKTDETCDYKHSTQPRLVLRLKKTYKRLTGKDSPPINNWMFRLDKPMTQRYVASPLKGIVSERWINGQQVKLGNVNVGDYHFNNSVVGLSILVKPYSAGGLHSIHAISAVKFNKHLFCFNAWGNVHYPVDINIYKFLANKYKCDNFMIYEGPSLQTNDPYGVCVGYASNFIIEMLLKIAENKMPHNPTQKKYDEFVRILK